MPDRLHIGVFGDSRRFRRVDGSPHGHIRTIGRAGGVVAALAGISGIIVTGYEIVRLMRDEDFMALSYANDVLVYGWGAVAAFAAIAGLGAVAARAKGKLVAIPVILCAIAAPFLLGVVSVIVFAVQAVVGALIVLFGKDSPQDARPPAP